MNTARCSVFQGLAAGLLALLVLAGSVVQRPVYRSENLPFVTGANAVAASNHATIYSPDIPPVNGILPGGSQLPDAFFERMSPAGPVATLDPGLPASFSRSPRPFAAWTPAGLHAAGVPFPRFAFLHVYRC